MLLRLLPLLWNPQEPWEHFCQCAVHIDSQVKLTTFFKAQWLLPVVITRTPPRPWFLGELLPQNRPWQREEVGIGQRARTPLPSPFPLFLPQFLPPGHQVPCCSTPQGCISAGSFCSLPHTKLQEMAEERVEKVVDTGHKGLAEGSPKFRKLRQGLRTVHAEHATCPFSLGHQPTGQHLSSCCQCILPCLEPPSEVLPLRIPSEIPPLLWCPLSALPIISWGQ